MCWATTNVQGNPTSYDCGSLNNVITESIGTTITKNDLKPGDALLKDDYWGETKDVQVRHAVLFGGWLNTEHTQYLVFEEGGACQDSGCANSHPVVYQYNWAASHFRPVRYINIEEDPTSYISNLRWTNAPDGGINIDNARWYRQNMQVSYAVDGSADTQCRERAGYRDTTNTTTSGSFSLSDIGREKYEYKIDAWNPAGSLTMSRYIGYDDQAPSLNWNGNTAPGDTWLKGSQFARWDYSDSLSNVKYCKYRWNDSVDWIDGGTGIAGLLEGQNKLEVECMDKAWWDDGDHTGNKTNINASFWLDNTAPNLTINGPESSKWFTTAQSINWSSSDSLSGINSTATLSWDGGQAQPINSSGTIAIPEGKHSATITVTDNVGNPTTKSVGPFWVDTGIPSLTITGPETSKWFKTAQNINWSSSDSLSGINSAATLFWDGGQTQPINASGTIVIPEGKHTATITVTDIAGNPTTKSVGPFWIDTGIPSLTITGPETLKWFTTAQSINWSSLDSLSGINSSATLSWDGGAVQAISASGTIAIPEGKHTATITVTDNAGNVTTKSAGSFWVDSTPPQVTASLAVLPTGDNDWYLTPTSLVMSATDGWSTVATLQYCVDGGEWITYNPSNSLTGDGKHIIECRATDVAGNPSAIVTLSYSLDTTLPGIPVVTVSPESSNTSILSANWNSVEPHSDIVEYDFAIGTTQGGTDVVKRTLNDKRPYAYVMNLNLTIGGKYYFTVWAKNGAGTWAIDAGFSTAITVVNGNTLDGPGGLFSAGGTGDIPPPDVRNSGGNALVDKMGAFVVFNSLSANFEILHGVDERLDNDYSSLVPFGESGSNRIRKSANYAICDVLGQFVVGSSTNGTASIQHGYFASLGAMTCVTLTGNLASPVGINKKVTFTATGIGGSTSEFRFVVATVAGGVTTYPAILPPFLDSNVFEWTPTATGQYAIVVFAREKGSTSPMPYAKLVYDVNIPPTAVKFTTNPVSATPGKSVTITATVTGGSSIQYKFSDGDTMLRDFTAGNTWQWIVPNVTGIHTLKVEARDINSANLDATVTCSNAYTVVPVLSSVTMKTTPLNAVLVGNPVTLYATAIGGVNVQYKFMAGTTTLRDFSASSNYTFTTTAVKTYSFTVIARDSGGVDPNLTVTSLPVSLDVRPVLSAVTLAVTPLNAALVNSQVTLTAMPTGGANVQYQFMNGATLLRSFNSSNTFTFNATAVKTYNFIVIARDLAGVDPNATVTSPTVNYAIKPPLTAVTLTTSPVIAALVGNTVTLTATTDGGANVQYQFMAGTSKLRSFSSSNTYSFEATAVKTYSFTVIARDLAAADPNATVTSPVVTFAIRPPLTAVSATAAPANSVLVGNPVTITATATGGANVQYQFMAGTTLLRSFNSSNTFILTTSVVKVYNITVTARDLGAIDPNATVTSPVVIITVKPALSGVSLTTNPPTTVAVGVPVTLTATAIGGANVQYKFMAGTSLMRSFNASNTYTFTPSMAKTYSFTVVACDTGGVDSTLTFTSVPVTLVITAVK